MLSNLNVNPKNQVAYKKHVVPKAKIFRNFTPNPIGGLLIRPMRGLQSRTPKPLLQSPEIPNLGPNWKFLTHTLKDKSKGNVESNYRPITCLPLMWNLLTAVIADQISVPLDQEKLLPEEQKGCKKGSRGTND